MRAIHIVVHLAAARGPEGLYRVELVLLHAGSFTALDDRHSFAGVDS